MTEQEFIRFLMTERAHTFESLSDIFEIPVGRLKKAKGAALTSQDRSKIRTLLYYFYQEGVEKSS